jgi:hypothetical protein
MILALIAASFAQSTTMIDLGLPSLPAEMRLPRVAEHSKANGNDKEGDCSKALAEALEKIGKDFDYGGSIFQAVNEADQPVTRVECEISKRGKATVQVRAYGVWHSDSAAFPQMSSADVFSRLKAARASAPLLSVGAFLRIDEVDGQLWLDAGGTSAGKVVLPAGLSVEQRAAATYQNVMVGLGMLHKLNRAVASVPELAGGSIGASGQYVLDATQKPGEEWEFRIAEADLLAFAANSVSSRDLVLRIRITRRTSFNDTNPETINSAEVQKHLPK